MAFLPNSGKNGKLSHWRKGECAGMALAKVDTNRIAVQKARSVTTPEGFLFIDSNSNRKGPHLGQVSPPKSGKRKERRGNGDITFYPSPRPCGKRKMDPHACVPKRTMECKNGHDAMRHRIELPVFWRTDHLYPDEPIGLRLKEQGSSPEKIRSYLRKWESAQRPPICG